MSESYYYICNACQNGWRQPAEADDVCPVCLSADVEPEQFDMEDKP